MTRSQDRRGAARRGAPWGRASVGQQRLDAALRIGERLGGGLATKARGLELLVDESVRDGVEPGEIVLAIGCAEEAELGQNKKRAGDARAALGIR